MNKLFILLVTVFVALTVAGCGDETKIKQVKETVIPGCAGKTTQELVGGLLQNPVWGVEVREDGKKFVTVNGTMLGEKLPLWVKEQKFMDSTFRFPLDPKNETFDPSSLDGILNTYRLVVCE